MVKADRHSVQMKVVVVYVYAPGSGANCDNYLFRFLKCYHDFPPGIEHETVIVLNGIRATSEITCLFSPLKNCGFIEHDNSGYDIGAFQCAARNAPCDMMVFFGASTFFTRGGWLLRMASAFRNHGNAQYGAMGNRGNPSVNVWPHIRTTAFWMNPELMNGYPTQVMSPDQRHPFEHGRNCFTEWLKSKGIESWVITRTKDLTWRDWDSDPQGYARGQQRDMLAGDRMCERPYFESNMCKKNSFAYCSPWSGDNCWPCLMNVAA